jgi:hypothetical protein
MQRLMLGRNQLQKCCRSDAPGELSGENPPIWSVKKEKGRETEFGLLSGHDFDPLQPARSEPGFPPPEDGSQSLAAPADVTLKNDIFQEDCIEEETSLGHADGEWMARLEKSHARQLALLRTRVGCSLHGQMVGLIGSLAPAVVDDHAGLTGVLCSRRLDITHVLPASIDEGCRRWLARQTADTLKRRSKIMASWAVEDIVAASVLVSVPANIDASVPADTPWGGMSLMDDGDPK